MQKNLKTPPKTKIMQRTEEKNKQGVNRNKKW